VTSARRVARTPAAPCRPQDAQSINASLFPLCAPGLTRAPLRARRPKRAPSAYMNFCKKERASIVKANPKATFGEVGKLLGAGWAKLSDAAKAKYK